ncbi:SDR family NAD(P)-dependent oxidoreductase [Sediminivirga luteola]|jgi:NAD(P)-dependent dehydrogenase (short-subunit alcohol dehydrogenase family)|uniref:SDR family NAD(P)-dependent oxidoreductase n=1 Tax=Sediminivirga luteola TaxID=1774748 RepID=UPI001F55AC07|nr:SDR family NAD(P)-dependent oxidoreductase [Sediminivirga luteola]MCI2266144.1 SDR family oxidoreductase [Sediminivirga luteola]
MAGTAPTTYEPDRIAGRTMLVTGAGNGLGRAISLALTARGARVVLVGRREHTLAEVHQEISAAGGQARTAPCDTSDPEAVAGLARELAGEDVSVLVNNAGIAGPVAQLTDIEPEEWDEVFDINVRGIYLMCRAFLPPMVERGTGDVINLASVSGKRPLPGRTPYVASKMAVIGLTATLAYEVGPAGVTVNSLSPGPVEGPRMDRNFRLEGERRGIPAEQAYAEFAGRAALNRLVTEDEVAAAVVAMLHMPGMCGADIDLSAGMIARS